MNIVFESLIYYAMHLKSLKINFRPFAISYFSNNPGFYGLIKYFLGINNSKDVKNVLNEVNKNLFGNLLNDLYEHLKFDHFFATILFGKIKSGFSLEINSQDLKGLVNKIIN